MRDGLLDWDCAGAISIPGMERSLRYIRAEGELPVRLPLVRCWLNTDEIIKLTPPSQT